MGLDAIVFYAFTLTLSRCERGRVVAGLMLREPQNGWPNDKRGCSSA